MNKKTFKKTILIDLDGVLNEYTGNFDAAYIPEMKPGADDFGKNLVEKGFEIKLFTTRNKILAAKWLVNNGLDKYITDITNIKELCYLLLALNGVTVGV